MCTSGYTIQHFRKKFLHFGPITDFELHKNEPNKDVHKNEPIKFENNEVEL